VPANNALNLTSGAGYDGRRLQVNASVGRAMSGAGGERVASKAMGVLVALAGASALAVSCAVRSTCTLLPPPPPPATVWVRPCLPAGEDAKSELRVEVVDEQQHPVQGAVVELRHQPEGTWLSSEAGVDGVAIFRLEPPQHTFDVLVSLSGYHARSLGGVSLPQGCIRTIGVSLFRYSSVPVIVQKGSGTGVRESRPTSG